MSSLFRKEVAEARRSKWIKDVSVRQPPSVIAIAALAITSVCVIIAFLCLGQYTRRSAVVGQLVPAKGLASVLSPTAGVVDAIRVQEGDAVTVRQSLAEISVPSATSTGGSTIAVIEDELDKKREGLVLGGDAQQNMLEIQSAGLARQIATIQSEIAHMRRELSTREAQARIERETLDRLRTLYAQNFVSSLQVQQQEAQLLASAGSAQALQREVVGAQQRIVQLQQARAQLPAQQKIAEASLSQQLADLEQARVQAQTQARVLIQAPTEGTVAVQAVKPGQTVQVGQPLLTILPASDSLQAEIYVPSRAAGFVKPGDRVLLRYDAFPYEKFGRHEGRVVRISRTALSLAELTATAPQLRADEPVYRVTVELSRQYVLAYGKRELLRPGMALQADVFGESRPIYQWLFEPLFSLRGRLTT